MLFSLAADTARLTLFIVCGGLLLAACLRHRMPQWSAPLRRRRLAVLALMVLAIVAIKLTEEVVAKESGPVDEAVLWWLRGHVPAALTGFFEAITFSGSARFLVPVIAITVVALRSSGRAFEAVLVGASSIVATLLVWGMKSLVGRARPGLWEAQWYAGSSFPSGHTLSTAAFATACALCVARIWPRAGSLAMALALLWTSLVAVSRLVLGVHWPSDVLAAMCLGAFIALLISVVDGLRHRQRRGVERPV
jgi:undecaprenyl-diphosphatase